MLARRSRSKQILRKSIGTVGKIEIRIFTIPARLAKLVHSKNCSVFFLSAWADNANACAKQYAGTGALKTDFTR